MKKDKSSIYVYFGGRYSVNILFIYRYFYELFKSEVVDELKTYADVIKETQSYDQILQENTILMWMTSGSQ